MPLSDKAARDLENLRHRNIYRVAIWGYRLLIVAYPAACMGKAGVVVAVVLCVVSLVMITPLGLATSFVLEIPSGQVGLSALADTFNRKYW